MLHKFLSNLLKGRKSATNPAKINLRNVFAVVQAFLRKFRQQLTIGGISLPQHQWEQIVWRRIEVRKKSYNCWRRGHCTFCGCDILGKTMEDRGCENPDKLCYPPMMDKATWEQYKQDHDVKFFD